MALHEKTILLVEDEPLIALDISMMLEGAGATVCGPWRTVEDALTEIEENADQPQWDGAILDFRLRDGTCEPIAERLNALGVPFVLHSGNSETLGPLASKFGMELVSKPSHTSIMLNAVVRCVANEAICDE